MLFNILTMIVTSIICFFFFRMGFNAGKDGTVSAVRLPQLPKISNIKKNKETEKMNKILMNLENFDGTSNKQVRV